MTHSYFTEIFVEKLVDRMLQTRKICRRDCNLLMSALSEGIINEAERLQINRVFDALREGQLRVVD
jgi:hypothetical protein